MTKRILHATMGQLAAVTLLTSTIAAQGPVRPAGPAVIDTMAIRAHTRFLSDNLLQGRGTGTEGERLAAAYIESQLIRLGVAGLGPAGAYTLPIPLAAATVLPETELSVSHSDVTLIFANGTDFVLNTGGASAFRDFRGRIVLAGSPADAATRLRAMRPDSLRGTVVAFNGPLGAAAVAIIPLLIEQGAAGALILIDDAATFELYQRSRGAVRYFARAAVGDPVWQPDLPVVITSPKVSDVVRDWGRAGARVEGRIRVGIADIPAANVGGIIRGTDPRLRDELIVYTAHYDHLGVSTPDARGDSIYNGFSDNAAGTAMLLAIADAFHREPPKRSVAFVFFTGEERGLLGSSYFVSAPPFPLEKVRAVINLDAGAPPAPPLSWRIAGGTESGMLGARAAGIATAQGWTADLSAASPNSDYWPFLARGVQSVFIVPGSRWQAPDGREMTNTAADALRARWDRYHQAGDEWHPEFPFSGLERYARYAFLLGRSIASE